MYQRNIMITLSLAATWLVGCTSSDAPPPEFASQQPMTAFYAHVSYVEKVTYDSKAREEFLTSTRDRTVNRLRNGKEPSPLTILEGGLWGTIRAVMEGDTEVFRYELKTNDGDSVIVVTEDKQAETGDCVFVDVLPDVKLSKVIAGLCNEDQAISVDYNH